MEFTKFDIKKHDLGKVSELIFETEPELQSLLFGKNKEKALSRIKKVAQAGYTSLGHDRTYIAIDKNIIVGLTIFFKGNEIDKNTESDLFLKTLDFLGILRAMVIEKILIKRLLTMNFNKNELYVANICVDKNSRGRGVGKFLLKNIVIQAKKLHCDKIILDVSKDNHIAINLYKKNGFNVIKERTIKLLKITVYKMIKDVC
jgi:ribosomal protein S18 acetylase RimI-like enzyme